MARRGAEGESEEGKGSGNKEKSGDASEGKGKGAEGGYADQVECRNPRTRYREIKCSKCGSRVRVQEAKYRKRALFILLCGVALAMYGGKNIYENAFKKRVLVDLVGTILESKLLSGINISESTRESVLTGIEYIASDKKEKIEVLPGKILHEIGVRERYPIVIIPGIANTNLEMWRGRKNSEGFFRKRVWGSLRMVQFMFQNRAEWLESMKLDSETGMDPPEVKVRPFFGLNSSDLNIPGLWVWWKIIRNLSELGYDSTALHFAAFDWRMGFEEMERRDRYFSKLKSDIEHLVSAKGKKSVLITHSLGSQVGYYFIKWAESPEGGRGGKEWVARHIKSIINIGGPLLGAPKAIAGCVTGEGKDTAQMGVIESALLELFFARDQRKELFKTWTSALMLLPKGGRVFWEGEGDEQSPDGCKQRNVIHITGEGGERAVDMDQIKDFLYSFLSPHNQRVLRERLDLGYAKRKKDLKSGPAGWINPLLSSLPNAPEMTIYTFYGVDIQTERAYVLNEKNSSLSIDVSFSAPGVVRGVCVSNGDGTVPILSSGYMAHSGWNSRLHNPHGVRSVIKEYKHNPSRSVIEIRGGGGSAAHINILGNHELTRDILSIVSGHKDVEERIVSNLPAVCREVERRKDGEKKKEK
jgi:phospholipid:diacylglycerol acyltransferase